MAQLAPCLDTVRHDPGLFREIDVLDRLQQSLPDGFQIFHSVGWHSIEQGIDRHGEIDLVVVGPTGNVLLMEVKAGAVALREGGIFKLYGERERDVARQTRMQHGAMVDRLAKAGLRAFVTNCLVLPDYRVGDAQVVAMPRERIIDADEFDYMGTRVRELLSIGRSESDVDEIRRFLANEFKVSVDLQVLGEQVCRTSRRLADGLATWVPRIVAPSGVIRVQATAGSGKTQLAVRLLGDAAGAGLRALYVCFNRTLADYIARVVPPRVKVTSFHELCVEHWRRTLGEPDFAVPDVFRRVAEHYGQAAAQFEPHFDLIVIDEGQDFAPDWVASLLPQLQPAGRLYLLEDEDQRLYARESFDLSDAVTLTCNENFRSPHAIVEVVNALGLADRTIEARSPYAGELPGFRTYDDERSLRRETAQAVQGLVGCGIAVEEIVVLTGHGRGRSALLKEDRIGDFRTRRYTGSHTAEGEPVWSDGSLLVESVYRFKGQSAAAVVLSEMDFDELDEATRRKLFVGMTRAYLRVEVVLSRRAEACIARALA